MIELHPNNVSSGHANEIIYLQHYTFISALYLYIIENGNIWQSIVYTKCFIHNKLWGFENTFCNGLEFNEYVDIILLILTEFVNNKAVDMYRHKNGNESAK